MKPISFRAHPFKIAVRVVHDEPNFHIEVLTVQHSNLMQSIWFRSYSVYTRSFMRRIHTANAIHLIQMKPRGT